MYRHNEFLLTVKNHFTNIFNKSQVFKYSINIINYAYNVSISSVYGLK